MKLLLQHKILLGYIILLIVIGTMATILIYEHIHLRGLENETMVIQQIQRDINTAHRQITTLATYGESVIAWTMDDYEKYKAYRLRVDSLLQRLKLPCREFIYPEQLDTFCLLLEQKEEHLYGIMQAVHRQDEADSLLLNSNPTGYTHTNRHTQEKRSCRTVRQKGDRTNAGIPQCPAQLERAVDFHATGTAGRP